MNRIYSCVGTPASRNGRKGKRFTLLELLFVMIIISIIMAFTMPAFTKMALGSSVDICARDIGGQLHLARQTASGKRKYVAVVFPTANGGIKPDYAFISYRTAIVVKKTNETGYDFWEWADGSKWRFAPEGAAIMEVDADIGINSTGNPGEFSRNPTDNALTTLDDVDLSGLGGTTDVDGVRCIIFAPGGAVRGTGQYVTVGQAKYTGGTWTIMDVVPTGESSTNESCRNQISLVVNLFTGSVSFKSPEEY